MTKRVFAHAAACAAAASGLALAGALLGCPTKEEKMDLGEKVNREVAMPTSENEMKMKDWRPPTAMLLAVLSTLLFGAGLPAAGAEGNPMIVGGFQVGERMQSILDQISGALDTVKDVDTAKEADATFAEAERRIVELEPFLLFLPHQGKTAIAAQVTGALIGMKPTADKLPKDVRHIALGESTSLDKWREKLSAAKIEAWEEDHGDQESIYFEDPNGIVIEITSPPSEPGNAHDEASVIRALRWLGNAK